MDEGVPPVGVDAEGSAVAVQAEQHVTVEAASSAGQAEQQLRKMLQLTVAAAKEEKKRADEEQARAKQIAAELDSVRRQAELDKIAGKISRGSTGATLLKPANERSPCTLPQRWSAMRPTTGHAARHA